MDPMGICKVVNSVMKHASGESLYTISSKWRKIGNTVKTLGSFIGDV